ncbi:hypothetical protein EVAR_16442_1 [Eumeta japonica]|uniref:Uncharacterized protein n=1 Tax=Eumeta variegata TaxID=151549 RepID=A0A4C1ULL2_EUMVA|nr:hypothetical protein EVAR_16442_1 [Eumeta japonica]
MLHSTSLLHENASARPVKYVSFRFSRRILTCRRIFGCFCQSVHAPDVSKPLEEREEFWAEVRDVSVKCYRNERILKFGDFIGWVDVQRDGYEKVLDMEKAHDKVKKTDLWRTLPMYDVRSVLILALQSLHRGSSACDRINGSYTDWFDIHRGVIQGCVASS